MNWEQTESERQKRQLEKEYLARHIFFGLPDRNTGFDVGCIAYFSEEDFEIVLDRVEEKGIGIYGIEPWHRGEFFDVTTCDESKYDFADPAWYREAFLRFKQWGFLLDYAASYTVPDHLLIAENN